MSLVYKMILNESLRESLFQKCVRFVLSCVVLSRTHPWLSIWDLARHFSSNIKRV